MNLTSIMTWIKSNLLISIGIGIVALLLFFPKVVKKLFGGTTRRRRRHVHHAITGRRRASRPTRSRRMAGAKKPWQIKGSLAAKRRMAQIRKKR